MPEPGFLVHGSRADGIVRLASHRSDHFPIWGSVQPPWKSAIRPLLRGPHRLVAALRVLRAIRGRPLDDAHYRKLAYSSHTAPEQGFRADVLDADSQLSLLRGRANVARRQRLHEGQVIDRFGASVWFGDDLQSKQRIETVTIARGAAEIRVHHVTSKGRPVRDGGFAVAAADPPAIRTDAHWSMARRADRLTSFIGGLHGFESAGASRLQSANPFGRHSVAPFLIGLPDGHLERVFVSLVVLTAEPFDGEAALDEIRAEVRGREVRIECEDGESFYVQLVAPEPVLTELSGMTISGPVRFARVSPDGTSFIFTT
jgi:hypothetical protein